jgi:RNA polymerase sigma-70 factor (ECF subfamily)
MAHDNSNKNAAVTTAEERDFHEQLKAILPRLRVYALSLTRDRDGADDLVHDTVVKALTGRHSFEPGTNLSAWVFRIQRNEFISGLRRTRPTVPVDTAIADSLSHQPHQESRLVMREFMSAFSKLAPTQREALLLAVLEGQSYEVIAAHTGVSVGTVKSRISRARDMLERLLLEGDVRQRGDSAGQSAERRPTERPADEPQAEPTNR